VLLAHSTFTRRNRASFSQPGKKTGRTKSFYAREAILKYLDDLEDIYLAEKQIEELKAGRSRTYTLDEVKKELGLED